MRTLTQNFIRMIDHLPGALLLAAVFLSPAATAWAQYVTNDTNAAWNPVLLRDSRLGAQNTVTLDSSEAFWYPRVTKLRDTSIPCGWSYVEAFITDCRNATLPNHPPSDALFAEGNHHKLTEATVYILSQWPNATDNPVQEPGQPTVTNFGTLAARVDAEADIARTAQLAHASRHPESSGYMHVRQSNFDAVPWENRYGCGDDYCMGYLMDMAAAHFIYSGGTNNKMLNISRDAALHCYNWFVVPSRPGTGVDGNIERGLLETYRCTGDSRIRDTANYFISQRGHNANGDPAPTLRLYFQDDVPIEQQQAINGHAGRAAGFYAGVANAVLLGRTDWYNAMFRVWRSDIKRKVYVSGGIGSWDSPNNGEAFSQNDYDLVNEYTGGGSGAYCESCSACDQSALAWRMARLKGDGESVDEMERGLYNAVAHAYSLDGTHTYYQNPLKDSNNPRYNAWVCCPPNVYRTMAGIGRYIYGRKDNDLWVNMFIASNSTIQLTNGNVPISLRTNSYPWDGRVTITVTPASPITFTMRIRMPGWCRNALLRINGKLILRPTIVNQYIVINRTWSNNDVVVFTMAMPPMRMEAHPSVTADVGRICIQRGPVIFALEGVDNPSYGDDPVVSQTPNLQASYNSGLLGGVEVITANRAGGGTLTFVPWHATANRANSWQRVWVQQESKSVRATSWNDRLYREYTP